MSPRFTCSGLLALLVVVGSAGHAPDTSQVADSLGYHLPRSLLVGATARLVAHADLNGDGKEDLKVDRNAFVESSIPVAFENLCTPLLELC